VAKGWFRVASDAVTTYRHLRIALIGTSLLIGAAVVREWAATGWRCLQPSISAYYYTPAQAALVGALVAAGVCMIVVRGNTEWENILLNVGGAVAPIIALVPTPDPGLCRSVPVTIGDTAADVANNVAAVLLVGLAVIVVAVVEVVRSRPVGASRSTANRVGLAVTVLLFLVVAATFTWARSAFLQHAHYAAAGVLFVCLVAVVTINAWSYGHRRARGLRPTPADYANAYAVVAVVMVGSVVLMLGWRFAFGWDHAPLWIETALIASFAAFWAIQTRELWNEGRRGERSVQAQRPDHSAGGSDSVGGTDP
jgi:hypothetical protein